MKNLSYKQYRKLSPEAIVNRIKIRYPVEKRNIIWWDYITALRGPDVDNEPLKKLFTCFLRGSFGLYTKQCNYFGIFFFESFVFRRAKKYGDRTLNDTFCYTFIDSNDHWRAHMCCALQATVCLGPEIEEIALTLYTCLKEKKVTVGDILKLSELLKKYIPDSDLYLFD